MEMVLHVAKVHHSHIEDDIFEPRQKERVEPEVMKLNTIKELQDHTKCFECKEKFSDKNTLQAATGKCMMCSILSYSKE